MKKLCLAFLSCVSMVQANPLESWQSISLAMASQIESAFPLMEGSVLAAEGSRVLVALPQKPAEVFRWNVEFFRTDSSKAGSVPVHRKIGGGRLLQILHPQKQAVVEALAVSESLRPGDLVRESTEPIGIALVFAARSPSEHQAIRELLALRIAWLLNRKGRFRAEAFASLSHEEAAWRGFSCLVAFDYVEIENQVTLLASLSSTQDGRVWNLLSARAEQQENWETLAKWIEGVQPDASGGIESFYADLNFQASAVLALEFQRQPAVLVLGRSELQLWGIASEKLSLRQSWTIPEEFILPRASRDFYGHLALKSPELLYVAHTLLNQPLELNLSTAEWQAQPSKELRLDPEGALVGEWEAGLNLIGALLLKNQALLKNQRWRFARWVSRHEILLQNSLYQLALFNVETASSKPLKASVGSGLSFSSAPFPLLAATEATYASASDQLTLYRLGAGGLEVFWKSEIFEGQVDSSSVDYLQERLCLAAIERLPSRSRLRFYINLPFS